MPEPRPSTPPLSVSAGTTESNRTGAWKYLHPEYHDRVAPCREACPAGIDVQGYMAMLREGRVDDACDLILRENPIPSVTGRVCDHPCESRCNRRELDEPVAVHLVERMLGDRILAAPLPPRAERTHAESVAVVGSGPAGLACAYHLVRLGYEVDVYEQDVRPGGMLRQGIPAYRLPRAVLDREIERLEALGVVFLCGARVGRSPSFARLAETHDAVFVGVGAQRGRRLGVPGEHLPGVMQGLEFLRRVNAEPPLPVGLGRRVVVVGGGNTAMDCARTALRLGGAGTMVTVVYRRTPDEMPAIAEEVRDAEREGVRFLFLATPSAIERHNGHLAVSCARMRLGDADASGRRRPVPTDEEPLRLVADTVLLAIGEEVVLDGVPLALGEDGALGTDAWGWTGQAAVFGGGDVTGEARTVARALGAGKRAAIGIDRFLRRRRGEAEGPPAGGLHVAGSPTPSMTRWLGDDPVPRVAPRNQVVHFAELNVASFARVPRHAERRAAGDGSFAEISLGLSPGNALAEAARCFECGVCNECELCLIYCADVAISRGGAGEGERLHVDLEHCKGCGVCAAECPRGAITMVREGQA